MMKSYNAIRGIFENSLLRDSRCTVAAKVLFLGYQEGYVNFKDVVSYKEPPKYPLICVQILQLFSAVDSVS